MTPRPSEEETRARRERLERSGWRPEETCVCPEPEELALVSVAGCYLTNVCGRCRRRLPERDE